MSQTRFVYEKILNYGTHVFPLTRVSTSLFHCFHMFLYHNLLAYSVNNDDIRC